MKDFKIVFGKAEEVDVETAEELGAFKEEAIDEEDARNATEDEES